MIPQGLFSLWFAFQKPSLVDQSNCLDPSANTSSGLLVPSQEKFLQRKLQGRNREKLNIHTSMHSRMEENNLLIANNFYFKLIRKAMRATGQSILHGKTDKSRKLSQQTWVTNLWRNMGGGKKHTDEESWTWKDETARKKHWTQISVRRGWQSSTVVLSEGQAGGKVLMTAVGWSMNPCGSHSYR